MVLHLEMSIRLTFLQRNVLQRVFIYNQLNTNYYKLDEGCICGQMQDVSTGKGQPT